MTGALLGPAEIRTMAVSLAVRPTKTLGQNFLHDPNTIRRIVRVAGLDEGEHVLEIGPGLGSLTLGLLEAGHRVTAVEIDPVLADSLAGTVAQRLPGARLRVLTKDAMALAATDVVTTNPVTTDLGVTGPGADASPTALVANLPYNVAVPVLLHALAVLPDLRRVLIMVQAEVADRLAAAPGSRVYGVPSVKTAWYARAELAGAVPRSVFWPVPNVDSGLVRLIRRDPPVTSATRAQVFAVIDAAFAQRRKTLRAALASWAGSPDAAEQALRSAGIDPRARGETLDVAAFARLAENRRS